MRMRLAWPLVLLLAVGCSRDGGAPPASTSGGDGPGAAQDVGNVHYGAANGGQTAAADGAAGRASDDNQASGFLGRPASALGGGPAGGAPGQVGGNAASGSTASGQPAGTGQPASEPEEASPGGAAIRSLGESFLRALSRAALSGGSSQTREPPAAEDDPFPQGEPAESQPDEDADGR